MKLYLDKLLQILYHRANCTRRRKMMIISSDIADRSQWQLKSSGRISDSKVCKGTKTAKNITKSTICSWRRRKRISNQIRTPAIKTVLHNLSLIATVIVAAAKFTRTDSQVSSITTVSRCKCKSRCWMKDLLLLIIGVPWSFNDNKKKIKKKLTLSCIRNETFSTSNRKP